MHTFHQQFATIVTRGQEGRPDRTEAKFFGPYAAERARQVKHFLFDDDAEVHLANLEDEEEVEKWTPGRKWL